MTEIGIIGDAPIVSVGTGGAIAGLAGGVRIDWWVGADDRWHRASVEVAVRQALAADGSAVETRLRVPGGDIVHRVTVVPFGGSGVASVEVVNETAVPVAVAMTVHAAPGEIDVRDDLVSVGGRAVVRAGRSVARVAAADTIEHLLATVEAGHAIPPGEADLPFSASHVAAIFPLPHTARLRAVCALEGGPVELPTPDALPRFDDVGRGWRAHLDGAMRVELPDPRLAVAVEAARRHLLSGSLHGADDPFWRVGAPRWTAAVAGVALAAWGHAMAAHDLLVRATEANRLALGAGRSVDETGALLWAWAELLGDGADPDLVAAVGPWVVDRVGDLVVAAPPKPRWWKRGPSPADGDAGWRALGLAAAAPLLTMVGEPRAAGDVVDALPVFASQVDPASLPAVLGGHRVGADGGAASLVAALHTWVGSVGDASLPSLGAVSGPTGAIAGPTRGHDPVASGLLLLAVRRALVHEPLGSGGPVEVFGGIDRSWMGSSMEVHDAPVAGGAVDVAVRWHGQRPALLWDLRSTRPLQLTAPGLDPGWSDERSAAEALLAPTPSLQVEPGPESPAVRRGEDLDADDEGPGSFA